MNEDARNITDLDRLIHEPARLAIMSILFTAEEADFLFLLREAGLTKGIRAQVPLAEMSGYATELRSATQGRGVFSMEFDHYAPVSESVAQKVLKN